MNLGAASEMGSQLLFQAAKPDPRAVVGDLAGAKIKDRVELVKHGRSDQGQVDDLAVVERRIAGVVAMGETGPTELLTSHRHPGARLGVAKVQGHRPRGVELCAERDVPVQNGGPVHADRFVQLVDDVGWDLEIPGAGVEHGTPVLTQLAGRPALLTGG